MAPRNKEFTAYPLNDRGIAECDNIRMWFDSLLNNLNTVCPDGREFSIVKTKLEEASFFAMKAVSIKSANQVC